MAAKRPRKGTKSGSSTTSPDRPTPPLRLEWIEAGTLEDNPANWRKHPPEQIAALHALIEDPAVGWAGALLYNEQTGRLIDGHGRKADRPPDELVPVLVGSWAPAAERKILLTLDPVGAMATAARQQLQNLIDDTPLNGPALERLRDERLNRLGISHLARQIETETERPDKTDADQAAEIAGRLGQMLTDLAAEHPQALNQAAAIVLPRRGSRELLVLYDPATRDAITELRRHADARARSPVAKLLAAILPLKPKSGEKK